MAKSIRKQQELPAQQAAALGQKVIFDIPLTADLERLTIALSGSVTLTTGAANLLKDGICEIIKAVEVIKDGSDTLVSLPFSQVVQGNMFRRRHRAAPTLLQPLLTIAAQPFSAIGTVDLSAFAVLRRKETSVRETDCKTLQLAITFASDFTGVFTGGGFVVSTSTLSLIVKADETVEMVDGQGQMSTPILKPLYTARDDSVSAAVTRQRFRLTPEQALRGITMRCCNSSNVNSDSVLSRVRVYTGNTLRYDMSAAGIRAHNQAEMTAAIPAGYYYLDFAEQGASPDRLNDCYDLRAAVLNGADAYIEYDSLAAMTATITQWGFKHIGG